MGKQLIRVVATAMCGLCAAGACACLFGGCGLEPGERLQLYAEALAEADARIQALEESLTAGRVLVSDVNLPAEERAAVLRTIDETQAVLVTAQTWRADVAEAVERAKAGGSEWGLLSDALTAGGRAVGGDAGGYLALGGLILSVVGNIFQRQRGGVKTKTLKAIVRGVEDSPAEAQASTKAAIGARMKAAEIVDRGNRVVDSIKKGA